MSNNPNMKKITMQDQFDFFKKDFFKRKVYLKVEAP